MSGEPGPIFRTGAGARCRTVYRACASSRTASSTTVPIVWTASGEEQAKDWWAAAGFTTPQNQIHPVLLRGAVKLVGGDRRSRLSANSQHLLGMASGGQCRRSRRLTEVSLVRCSPAERLMRTPQIIPVEEFAKAALLCDAVGRGAQVDPFVPHGPPQALDEDFVVQRPRPSMLIWIPRASLSASTQNPAVSVFDSR